MAAALRDLARIFLVRQRIGSIRLRLPQFGQHPCPVAAWREAGRGIDIFAMRQRIGAVDPGRLQVAPGLGAAPGRDEISGGINKLAPAGEIAAAVGAGPELLHQLRARAGRCGAAGIAGRIVRLSEGGTGDDEGGGAC